MLAKAVFFDRDGVLNEALYRDGKAYAPLLLEEMIILPVVAKVVRELSTAGFLIFVFSNQPDVSRGTLDPKILDQMNQKLMKEVPGIREIFICPHDNHHQCECRKPKPGMIVEASKKWGIDLQKSFAVGDRKKDIEAGKTAGCKTVLIDAPYNQEAEPDYRANGLQDACDWILKQKEVAK